MTTDGTKATAASTTEAPLAAKENSERELTPHRDEGIGVFRAILITVLLYIAVGFAAWFAWNLYRQLHGH